VAASPNTATIGKVHLQRPKVQGLYTGRHQYLEHGGHLDDSRLRLGSAG
jgi:hypothetical protein